LTQKSACSLVSEQTCTERLLNFYVASPETYCWHVSRKNSIHELLIHLV